MTPDERQLSNSMSGSLLACVRRDHGDDALRLILRAAGDPRELAQIEDPAEWSSYDVTRRLFHAAVEVTGDPDLARRAGAEVIRRYGGSELVALLRGFDGPESVMPLVAELSAKQTTISELECLECSAASAVISSRIHAGLTPDRSFCDYRTGLCSSIPTLFGLKPAEVEESECQLRGDRRCVYRLTWDPTPDPSQEVAFLRDQVSALTSRFEALEELASELAVVGEIEDVLDTITSRASVAVRAPQYVLAVRLLDDESPRIHSIGVPPADVASVADEILSDPVDDGGGSRLVVDITGAGTRYGRLAALNPTGHHFVAEERRLLKAYAAHAARALETATAWEENRRQMQTLKALLDLSRALTVTRSTEEAAERLAVALPKVLGCEQASVWVYRPDDHILVCEGHSALGDLPAAAIYLTEQTVARMGGAISPWRLESTELQRLAELSGFSQALAMPVVVQHELFGMAVASTDGLRVNERAVMFERLPGVASLAAGAFATAQLFDQIRHLATHDPLTGLPNLRAFTDETAADPSESPCPTAGVIFVDLDRFKQVNDRFGHAIGDQLLVAVGQRLRAAVRRADRVIRIGGDEFAIQLCHLCTFEDAQTIATRLLRTVASPFELAGHTIHISASVGVALVAHQDESLDTLLSRSDAAMYAAKSAGGATSRFAEVA